MFIAQHLAEISRALYEGAPRQYYHYALAKMLTHKASQLVHTRVKADESQGILTYLLFVTRKVLQAVMKIPPEYFYLPVGSRSLPRILLKYLGMPSVLYLQPKSGFDLTDPVLKDPRILWYMIERVKNCWASEYINIDKLTPLQTHNVYNVCELTS